MFSTRTFARLSLLFFSLWIAGHAVAAEPEVLEVRMVLDLSHNKDGKTRVVETAPRVKVFSGNTAEVTVSELHDHTINLKLTPKMAVDGFVDVDMELNAVVDGKPFTRRATYSTPLERPMKLRLEDPSSTVVLETIIFKD